MLDGRPSLNTLKHGLKHRPGQPNTATTRLRHLWRGYLLLDGVDATSLAIVAAMGLLDAAWSRCVPFRLPQPGLPLLAGALLGAIALIYATVRPDARLANYAFCAALWFIFPDLGGRLAYLAASLAAPLQDDFLARLDQAIGFDWVGFFRIATRTRWFAALLSASYMSYFIQPVFSMFVFMARGDTRRNSDLLNSVLIALVITIIVSAILPAYGAWEHYGILPPKPENIDLQRLRSGAGERFTGFNGIVSFPSFHTAMLVLILHAHRGRWTFWPFACLNMLMLLSVPINGGHYATDMLAGGIVALGSIRITRLIRATRWGALRAGGTAQAQFPAGQSDSGGAVAGSWLAGPNPSANVTDGRA